METTTVTTRRPRFRRHRFVKLPFVLQERDQIIVKLVAEYRFISSEEIVALISGSDQTILRRLQKLYHAGYLDRPRSQKQFGNAKMIYALGQKGVQLLAKLSGQEVGKGDWSEKNRQVRLRYLEHTLMVSRFRAALTLAARAHGGVKLEQWRQGQELHDQVTISHPDRDERIPIYPDAFLSLHLIDQPAGKNRIHAFLEADRGTMTTKRFLTKVRGYWHYWRSGRQGQRFGMKTFLVLTLTVTPERADSLRTVTAGLDAPKHRGLRMFMFGSERNYNLDRPGRILESIWATATDSRLHSVLE